MLVLKGSCLCCSAVWRTQSDESDQIQDPLPPSCQLALGAAQHYAVWGRMNTELTRNPLATMSLQTRQFDQTCQNSSAFQV